MWIDGAAARPAGRDEIAVVNPATEERIGAVVRGTAADAEAAVAAAARAFPAWARVDAAERVALLREVSDKLAAHREELADLLVAEQGKPRRDNLDEVSGAVDAFAYYAGFAWHDCGVVNPVESSSIDFTIRGPVGPVVAIAPWNFPLLLMTWMTAPALAAGCTVVVKPSEETPLSALRFAELVADHLPPGVFNVVTGYGAEVGEPLVADPRIRHVSFTGSTATGRRIATLAAEHLKHVTLELGGKDALIVGPDVELESVVPTVASAALLNAGQVCTSAERIFVAEPLMPAFVDALVEHVRAIRVGDGSREDVEMGPLIHDEARRKVAAHVAEAVAGGGRVLTGGGPPADAERGWFYAPTVVLDAPASAALLCDETFGPVIPVAAFSSVDEAIARANDSAFGLGASVLSNDAAFVKRCIDGLEVGNVFVNDPGTANIAAPFGGTKTSGLGRELGVEGFEAYRETKRVHWTFGS
jgi:acyl-CoA reductase-like NAD-dependent aldehyde dehydrogenase